MILCHQKGPSTSIQVQTKISHLLCIHLGQDFPHVFLMLLSHYNEKNVGRKVEIRN